MTNDGWSTKPVYAAPRCRHHNIATQCRNVHFKDDNLHYLEIFGFCTDCQKHVTFVGIPSGKVVYGPSMTSDGVMVRLPFVCEGDVLKI